uniref:Radical SAM core domain-containing protein n=1 Tax=Glossina austeni TaxID=7395 RepID=A0A1A9UYQ5_GLOAU
MYVKEFKNARILLWQLVEVIPENCMLCVCMTNPPYILDHLEEIAKILKHPRVYSFLHVPVQSGSDAVLGDMKRLPYFETTSSPGLGQRMKAAGGDVGGPSKCIFDLRSVLWALLRLAPNLLRLLCSNISPGLLFSQDYQFICHT